jgi:hypothetical protein
MNAAIGLLLAVQMSLGNAAGDPACDPRGRDVALRLRGLLQAARSASRETERGMFLTRGPDGALGSVLWPATMQRRKATWRGPVPPETIAIAHTHPHGMPKPSQHDLAEAERTRLPIYVVTRTSIYRVDPDRTVRAIAEKTDWAALLDRGDGEVCLA